MLGCSAVPVHCPLAPCNNQLSAILEIFSLPKRLLQVIQVFILNIGWNCQKINRNALKKLFALLILALTFPLSHQLNESKQQQIITMKFSAPLLLALAAAPFTMGLKADQLDETSVLRRTKGMSDDDYTSYSGKVSKCCDLVGSLVKSFCIFGS